MHFDPGAESVITGHIELAGSIADANATFDIFPFDDVFPFRDLFSAEAGADQRGGTIRFRGSSSSLEDHWNAWLASFTRLLAWLGASSATVHHDGIRGGRWTLEPASRALGRPVGSILPTPWGEEPWLVTRASAPHAALDLRGTDKRGRVLLATPGLAGAPGSALHEEGELAAGDHRLVTRTDGGHVPLVILGAANLDRGCYYAAVLSAVSDAPRFSARGPLLPIAEVGLIHFLAFQRHERPATRSLQERLDPAETAQRLSEAERIVDIWNWRTPLRIASGVAAAPDGRLHRRESSGGETQPANGGSDDLEPVGPTNTCVGSPECKCPGFSDSEIVILQISPTCSRCGHPRHAHIIDE